MLLIGCVWWYPALGGATVVTILTQRPVCPSPPVASFAASLVHRIMMGLSATMPSRRSSQFAAWDRWATSWWTHRSRGGGRCRIILVCIGLADAHGTKLLIQDVRCHAASGGNPDMARTAKFCR